MTHKSNFYWLDLMRGVAAILVFLSHIRVLYFLDYSEANRNIPATFFYFITGFGHPSVILFFVLSGFLIVRSIDQAVENGRWSPWLYATDRISRLWVVLIPALFLTAVIDRFGTTLYPASLAYTGGIESLKEVDPVHKSSFDILLGNFFFVQTILVPTFGSNTPLWSLAYEFWYYVLFPIMYFAILGGVNTKTRLLYCFLSIVILFFVGREIALYYTIWLMGGAAYFVHKQNTTYTAKTVFRLLCILILFFVVLSLIRINKYPFVFNSYTLGISTALLVISLANYEMNSGFLQKVSLFFSNISYTLYLVHMPMSIFLASALAQERKSLTATNFFTFIVVCVLILGLSYFLWTLFERKTPYVRAWMREKVGVTQKRSADIL